MSSHRQSWIQQLKVREEAGLLRQHRLLESPQQPDAQIDGRSLIAFCSNDYLGMANHPEVKQAAIDAIERCGVGSGASHLVVGHHREHQELERELAEFTGRERALVFSTGYMANLAVISALVGKRDFVFEDKLNHASLIDGGLLSGARFQRYLHRNMASLEGYLQRYSTHSKTTPGLKLVVTDGVFSMDGDIANLPELASLCRQYDALLMVDDAHGIGVTGPEGGGSVLASGLSQEDVPVLMGTFGKALGTAGAFVAGSEALIEYLLQMARPYIYTTAMPPAIAAATRKSLAIVRKADDKRRHLSGLIQYFRQKVLGLGYVMPVSHTPIQPIMVGDSRSAMALSQFLEDEGVLVTAIRPPTVPDNTARLRVTLSAEHSYQQVDKLLAALSAALSTANISGQVSF